MFWTVLLLAVLLYFGLEQQGLVTVLGMIIPPVIVIFYVQIVDIALIICYNLRIF